MSNLSLSSSSSASSSSEIFEIEYSEFVQRQLTKLENLGVLQRKIQCVFHYLISKNENEKKAIMLAEKLLKSSFDILKSNGFQDFFETLRSINNDKK